MGASNHASDTYARINYNKSNFHPYKNIDQVQTYSCNSEEEKKKLNNTAGTVIELVIWFKNS